MKTTDIVPKDIVKDIIEMIEDWFKITITEDYVNRMYNEDQLIRKEIDNRGYYDTVVREYMADFIAKDVTGADWPKYGDVPGYSRCFGITFKVEAPKVGIKVNWK